MKKLASIAIYAAVFATAIPQYGCFLVRSAARAGAKHQARQDFAAQTGCQQYDAEHLRTLEVGTPTIDGYLVERGEAVEVVGCGQRLTYVCYLIDRGGQYDTEWRCR